MKIARQQQKAIEINRAKSGNNNIESK